MFKVATVSSVAQTKQDDSSRLGSEINKNECIKETLETKGKHRSTRKHYICDWSIDIHFLYQLISKKMKTLRNSRRERKEA